MWAGRQPSSRLALAFDAPRMLVIIECACAPAAIRTSQPGSRRGGGAPTLAARAGSHVDTGAGSSSTWMNENRPAPLPMIGKRRLCTSAAMLPSSA